MIEHCKEGMAVWLFFLHVISGCGSAWLERLVWDQEVAGSNPVTPIARYHAGVVQW